MSNPYIINNTISDNTASSAGGIGINSSDPIIINAIFWDNMSNTGEIRTVDDYYPSNPVFLYTNIGDTLWPGEGNISLDPLFRDPDNGDYHLMSAFCGDPFDSPCIDAGDPSIFDYILDCDFGLGSERSDMGAYGGMAIPTDIREYEHDIELPKSICLSQNYPNPFNSSTVINYSLPITSFVTVSIYNVLGQLETTIFEGIQQAGMQTIIWDADEYPSGIYFARVEADERAGSIRMVLVK